MTSHPARARAPRARGGRRRALAGPLARTARSRRRRRYYDDGNSEVPGGLAGDPERVIVVGAGWAGLTVGERAAQRRVDHVVLDGRKRIGGRAHTADLGGIPIDLGCSWIHGPIGNPMTQFAEQAGRRAPDGNVELDAPIIRFFDGFLDRELQPGREDPAARARAELRAERLGDASPTSSARAPPCATARRSTSTARGSQGDARRQTEFLIRSSRSSSTARLGRALARALVVGQLGVDVPRRSARANSPSAATGG